MKKGWLDGGVGESWERCEKGYMEEKIEGGDGVECGFVG